MGLSERLSRYAVRRAHVLVVEAPGAWVVRAHLERAVLLRGWRLAPSPADADVLAVCGTPGPELTEVVERLWEQLPGPRVRVDLLQGDGSLVTAALDDAAAQLGDTEHHRQDARSRAAEPDLDAGVDSDHEDMDHGDMQMSPDGIPLAEGAEDRDGLEMDVLHLRLGPVLPHWPAGLVLRCTLQGDVIGAAEGRVVDRARDTTYEGATLHQMAWRCDNIARLLALAGWEGAAVRARRLRDAHLESSSRTDIAAAVDRLRRQVTGSRSLRWSLRGLRPLTAEELADQGRPEHLLGDTYDRLLVMLDRLSGPAGGGPEVSPGAVASVVVGLDLAAARLVIASLDLTPVQADRVVTHA